ncbi:TetR/AcrR family transcriptional regulator [Streptomyces katrae]|uniref:TetR/AcrR family transcriptional regulator n=1 Tax=Streptomyces katrae TaxID=68223 RepID=UPI0004C18DF7|nr:TetR/AcrR family transcriptional regulator [Streptomyces katrae]
MARVSQEHLDARRRQILDGATLCFSRNGFHATSMQDVLREVDLSAGAVYRYFSGKEELIAAIATEALAAIRGAFERAAEENPPPLPDVLLAQVLGDVLAGRVPGSGRPAAEGAPGFPRVALQVWAETLRTPELATALRHGFGEVHAAWSKVVVAYQEAGLMRNDVPADRVARTLMAVAQGFIAQQALFGDVEVEQLQDGLRGLMSMTEPKIK